MNLKKGFFELMKNTVFGKSNGKYEKHREIRLVTTERRKNQLVSEPNHHITNFFTEYLLAIK